MEAIEKLRPLARRAGQHTSFDPEKRGDQLITEYSADLESILTEIPEQHRDWVTEKYVRLLSECLYASSRCISAMITGPANFPTARANKYNDWERKHYGTFYNWKDGIAGKLARKARKENYTIEGEIQHLTDDLETMQSNHARMKEANRIASNKKLTTDEKMEALENIRMTEISRSDVESGKPLFYSFTLTNHMNRIHHREARIKQLQKQIDARESEAKETEYEGIRVVENVAENRLQLFFDGKPERRVIDILKQNGYRWSNKNGCWQSYLSGMWKLERVLKEIEG